MLSAIYHNDLVKPEVRREQYLLENFVFPTWHESEVSFVEDLLLQQKLPVNEEEIIKMKKRYLFKLWNDDLRLYNKEIVKKALRDHWGFWKKKQANLSSALGHCSALLDLNLNLVANITSFLVDLKNTSDLAFSRFRQDMIYAANKVNPANMSIPNDRHLIINSAYLISLALQDILIDQHQRDLDKKFKAKNADWANNQTFYEGDRLNHARELLDRAVSIDGDNYATYNARAYFLLVTEASKYDNIKDAAVVNDLMAEIGQNWHNAWRLLVEEEIPRQQNELALLASQELGLSIIGNTSQLYEQYAANINLLSLMAESLQGHLNRLRTRSPNQIIKLKGSVLLTDMLKDFPSSPKEHTNTDVYNTDKNANNEFSSSNDTVEETDRFYDQFLSLSSRNESSVHDRAAKLSNLTTSNSSTAGMDANNHTLVSSKDSPILQELIDEKYALGYLAYETETYALKVPKRKGWLGTFLAAAIGIACICLGAIILGPVGVSTTSIFSQSLGIGLISSGVGDIIQSIVSIASGNPIDIAAFLQNKAVSVAVILVTSMVASYFNISVIKDATKFSITKEILKQFAVQSALLGAGVVIERLTSVVIDDKEDTEHKVSEMIHRLLGDHQVREQLKLLFAADRIRRDGIQVRSLLKEAYSISIDYSTKFLHQTKDFKQAYTIVSQAASPIITPVAQLIAGTATSTALAGFGYFNYLDAANDFENAYRHQITEQLNRMSFRSRGMMQKVIETHFDPIIASGLNKTLHQQGWFLVDWIDIDYQHCEKLSMLDFGEWKAFQEATQLACEMVREELTSETLAEVQMTSLEDNLKKIVYGNIRKQFRSDVVSNAASAIGRLTSQTIAENVAEFIDDLTMQDEVKLEMKKLEYATKESAEQKRKEDEKADLRANEKRLREKIAQSTKARMDRTEAGSKTSTSSYSSSSSPSSTSASESSDSSTTGPKPSTIFNGKTTVTGEASFGYGKARQRYGDGRSRNPHNKQFGSASYFKDLDHDIFTNCFETTLTDSVSQLKFADIEVKNSPSSFSITASVTADPSPIYEKIINQPLGDFLFKNKAGELEGPLTNLLAAVGAKALNAIQISKITVEQPGISVNAGIKPTEIGYRASADLASVRFHLETKNQRIFMDLHAGIGAGWKVSTDVLSGKPSTTSKLEGRLGVLSFQLYDK